MAAIPATWNTDLQLDAVLSTSIWNYRKELFEQVTTSNFVYHRMYQKGNIRTEDGGEAIVVPVMYALNDTVKFHGPFDILDVRPQDGITMARYEWRQLAGSLSIAWKEERQNAGRHKLMSLMDGKMKQLRISLEEKLGRILYADGSEDSNQAFLGLDALVETGAAGFSTVGGIDSAANTWWRNQVVNAAAGDFDDGSAGAKATGDTILGQTLMRQLYMRCVKGNRQPNIGVTHVTTFEEYEAALTDHQRFVDTETASHGFMNLKFKNAIMVWDADYIIGTGGVGTLGRMYFLNDEFLEVIIDQATNFKPTPFIRPHNQPARTSQIEVMGNMVTTARRLQGVMYNFT